MDETEDAIRGGALPFATGIAEVQLPMQERLRTIEATERAAQELARRAAERGKRAVKRGRGAGAEEGDGSEGVIAGNFSTNFSKHRREHAQQMRRKVRPRLLPGGGTGSNAGCLGFPPHQL